MSQESLHTSSSSPMQIDDTNSLFEDIDAVEEGSNFSPVKTNEPYIGLEFDDLDEVYNFYNCYARNSGFGIRKNSSSKSRITGNLIWKSYVCDKVGKKVIPTMNESTTKARRRDTRVGCGAKLDVRKNKYDKWFVSSFVKQHNHALDTPRKNIKA